MENDKAYHQYLHVENINSVEVEDILRGTCHIFSKLDGANGSAWWDNGILKAGSRKRELSIERDNAGFKQWVVHNERLIDFFNVNQDKYRLFGEWLVPHNLRTYLDEAWRQFYIFDVYNRQEHKYLPYREYATRLVRFGLSIIPCMQTVVMPALDYLMEFVNSNDYLIKKDQGLGEGIVIKNYKFMNKYGRFTYAKIVRDECKQIRGKTKIKNKLPKGQIEQLIVDKYITSVLCKKAYAKIENENNGWSSRFIPQLLNTIFHDLVVENTWDTLKKYRNPIIDFKRLQRLCNDKVKTWKMELF